MNDDYEALPEFIKVVNDWQQRLLQLDRRNSLIYFRPGRTAVKIMDYRPCDIMELVSSRSKVSFDYAESRGKRPTRRVDSLNAEDTPAELESYVVPGDLRGDCTPLDLQRRLGNLRKRAREWREEQGLNVLFLALGFLEWIDEDGEDARAPLLLLPCDLDRSSPRDPFLLTYHDEDLVVNETLGVKLREFGIELPEINSRVESISEYAEEVKKRVRHRPDWAITQDVYLAAFSYSKLAMWRDLESIKQQGPPHEIIGTLAGTGSSIDSEAAPEAPAIPNDLAGGKLDDLLDIRDQFCILPADYSQLLAITSARSGSNLVIHGPPGTGKSQTIANIIATLLAEDKTVLFVSEKTAALDIVKRRLSDNNLGVFCLDLHSERGRKSSVYDQLRQSVEDFRTVEDPELDYDSLSRRREELNAIVRALHQERRPLDMTAFNVQGRFSLLRDTPHAEFQIRGIAALDKNRLSQILTAAERVSSRSREFREHHSSHWRMLQMDHPPLELSNMIRSDMTVIRESVEVLKESGIASSSEIGLRAPDTITETVMLEKMLRHLRFAPGVPPAWIRVGEPARLIAMAEDQFAAQKSQHKLQSTVSAMLGNPIPELDYSGLLNSLCVDKSEDRKSLSDFFNGNWSELLVQRNDRIESDIEELLRVLGQLSKGTSELAGEMKWPLPKNWCELLVLIQSFGDIVSLNPVPVLWLEHEAAGSILDALDRAEAITDRLRESASAVSEHFELDVVNVADEQMLQRFKTNYSNSILRFISRGYRREMQVLSEYRKEGSTTNYLAVIEQIEEILRLKNLQIQWQQYSEIVEAKLLWRYAGRETDWQSVRQDLQKVDSLLKYWDQWKSNLERSLTDQDISSSLRDGVPHLQRELSKANALIDQWVAPSLAKRLRSGRMRLKTFENMVDRVSVLIEDPAQAASRLLQFVMDEVETVDSLRDLAQDCADLCALEMQQAHLCSALSTDFGIYYDGLGTDWPGVISALEWASELIPHMYSDTTSSFNQYVSDPKDGPDYADVAEGLARALEAFREAISTLQQSYDLDKGPWGYWNDAEFGAIVECCEVLIDDADAATDWLAYLDTAKSLDDITGSRATSKIREVTVCSDLIPKIVERRILQLWLDQVYQEEPRLADFASSDQQGRIDTFKEMDQQLEVAACYRIREAVFQKFPNIVAGSTRGSELGILRGELSKKRRQWPVRKLFKSIPRVIQTLKPCFLMSPLSVSQYLPFTDEESETLAFDVIVFDEASQVYPEDAIPAICRGTQLIVAGDRKQLPPSQFWRRSLDVDYEDNENEDTESENQLEGRESILDACVGLVGHLFDESHLNVHYRSQHESLIRFSNHYYYDNRLLTFPSPRLEDPLRGVHSVYVPSGRYDAGRTRTNRVEADRVVDLVFEHMRTRPSAESLGVVTLSRAQADLIERLVEDRRILERDVETLFTERKEEPFFVKNLENVQGDERDHIIISVGYGPTLESEAVPNRFGPLNTEGGERRLNVVVTRARVRVDLVHSLTYADIRSQQPGPRLLRRYLEYISNPERAFEGQVTIDLGAEPESPFELAVEQALTGQGHQVRRQVGVSKYRIDLAILSDDGEGFDLGIECDGATYHSGPAARDRDWLRQQVLEGLGWRIHRVWSTAWARNPRIELERIEEALAVARTRQNVADNIEHTTSRENQDHTQTKSIPQAPAEVHFDAYVEAELPEAPGWARLQNEVTEKLVELIHTVAEAEGPVHRDIVVERIRHAYDLGRVSRGAREHLNGAFKVAEGKGQVQTDGEFLYTKDEQLARLPRKPIHGKIELMPPQELRIVVLETAKVLFGVTRKDFVIEVCRQLGFARTGRKLRNTIDGAIGDLLEQGRLTDSSGMLHHVE